MIFMEEQSLIKTVGKGTFWFASSTIFLKGIGLISTFFVLRYLSVYEYGLVTLVLSIIPLFGILLLSGLGDVVVADMGVARSENNTSEMRGIFFGFILTQTILGIVAWTIVFFGADIIANFYEGEASNLLKIISFAFLIAPIRTALGTVFNVYFKFFAQSLFVFLEEVIKLVIIVFAIFVFEHGASGVIFAHMITPLLSAIILLPVYIKTSRNFTSGSFSGSLQPFLNIIKKHGKWGIFSDYVSQVTSKSRLWIIKFLLGTEAVALFAVAQGFYGHISSLLPINRVITPIIPQLLNQKDRLFKFVNKSIKYQFIGFLILGISSFFFVPPVLVFLFPQYGPTVPLLRIFLIALLLLPFVYVFNPMIYALKAQKMFFVAVLSRVFITVGLLLLFIKLFGLYGVIYEIILTLVYLTAVRYFWILKKLLPGFSISPKTFIEFDSEDKLLLHRISSYAKSYVWFLKK